MKVLSISNIVLGLFLLYSAAFFNLHWGLRVLDVAIGGWCLYRAYSYFFGGCEKDTCCRK